MVSKTCSMLLHIVLVCCGEPLVRDINEVLAFILFFVLLISLEGLGQNSLGNSVCFCYLRARKLKLTEP